MQASTQGKERTVSNQKFSPLIESSIPPPPAPPKRCPKCCYSRACSVIWIIIIILLIIGGSIVLILMTPTITKKLQFFLTWLQHHPISGYFLFFLVYTIAVPLFIPVFILTLIGSLAFKEAHGFLISQIFTSLVCFAAALFGGMISFLIARYMCRKCIRKHCFNRFQVLSALDHGLQKHGIKLVALMRLSLIVPYNVFNYVMGTTRIAFCDFVIGSLPMVFLSAVYVFLGCSLNDITDMINGEYKGSEAYKILLIIGIVLAVLFVVSLVLITRHEFKKLTRAEALRRAEEDRLHINGSVQPMSVSSFMRAD